MLLEIVVWALIIVHVVLPFGLFFALRLPEILPVLSRGFGPIQGLTMAVVLAHAVAICLGRAGSPLLVLPSVWGFGVLLCEALLLFVLARKFREEMDPELPENLRSLKGSVAIVTGGNTGIGYESALGLARLGADVVIAARDPQKGAKAVQDINKAVGSKKAHFIALDLMSLKNIAPFVAQFKSKFNRLDVLVNNAGMAFVSESQSFTKEGYETGFGVMHLGHFLLTRSLFPLLAQTKGSRVINVASAAHGMASRKMFENFRDDSVKSGKGMYYRAKLCNVLFTREMHNRFGSQVKAYVVHPGAVYTGIWNEFGAFTFGIKYLARLLDVTAQRLLRSSAQGAMDIIYISAAPAGSGIDELGSGDYFISLRPVKIAALGLDAELASKLWKQSNEFINEYAAKLDANADWDRETKQKSKESKKSQ